MVFKFPDDYVILLYRRHTPLPPALVNKILILETRGWNGYHQSYTRLQSYTSFQSWILEFYNVFCILDYNPASCLTIPVYRILYHTFLFHITFNINSVFDSYILFHVFCTFYSFSCRSCLHSSCFKYLKSYFIYLLLIILVFLILNHPLCSVLVPCILFLEACILYPVSCALYPVPCIMYTVS